MTEAIAFDTYRFVKRLTDCGFTEKQAETLAEEHVALINGNLSTKTDIEALRHETKTDIEVLRQETKAGIAKVEARIAQVEERIAQLEERIARLEVRIEAAKSDILKWMFGAMIAQGGLIVALVKFL